MASKLQRGIYVYTAIACLALLGIGALLIARSSTVIDPSHSSIAQASGDTQGADPNIDDIGDESVDSETLQSSAQSTQTELNQDAPDVAATDISSTGKTQIAAAEVSKRRRGRWRKVSEPESESLTASPTEAAEINRILALPYTGGTSIQSDSAGVTVYDTKRTAQGLNLCNSGHDTAATLMDMEGNVLHEWRCPIEKVWPAETNTKHNDFWRRAHWYPNGDLLAIFEGIGMVKLDRDSNVLWSYHGKCHHQVDVADDGSIYVLTREFTAQPSIRSHDTVLEDFITILNSDGTVRAKHSVLSCIRNSKWKHRLGLIPRYKDILHTNTLYVLDGRWEKINPAFRKGNVLISVLYLDMIGVLDLAENRLVWALTQHDIGIHRQHDPRLLDNGNLLLFDNRRGGRSRVIELDPRTNQVVWQFGDKRSQDLWTRTCGASQRLANGNTLISESDRGRALEVTPDGEVVWEYHNPNRTGEQHDYVATLFEVIRVDRDYFPWLNAAKESANDS